MSANWIKIAESVAEIPFNTNGLAEVQAGSKTICIGIFQKQLFAFTHKCPHAGGLLVAGWIDAPGNVVCPLHRYKFCMRNGRNVSGEGYYLKHWLLETRPDGIWVAMEESSLRSLFR